MKVPARLFTLLIFFSSTILFAQQFTILNEVWTTPYKSQGETGTCWCFSTTSFLESEAHRLGRGDFELSQMFTVYNTYNEKSLRHIRSHNEIPFREGGLSHDVIYIIKKYGAVPRSEFPGYPEGNNTYDHRELVNNLAGILKNASSKTPLEGEWTDGQFRFSWMDNFIDELNKNIGTPPQSFEYNGKEYTPVKFASEVLNLPLDDYIEITSYSIYPFYTQAELLLPDNWLHYNKFYNVPLEDYMRILDNSLEKGYSVVADLHVTGIEMTGSKNFLLGHDEENGLEISQRHRDMMLETWLTEDVHLEHIIGTAADETGKKFYKAKDSLAPDKGEGRLYNKEYFSENFVKSRVLFYMIHKDAIPQDIAAKLGI